MNRRDSVECTHSCSDMPSVDPLQGGFAYILPEAMSDVPVADRVDMHSARRRQSPGLAAARSPGSWSLEVDGKHHLSRLRLWCPSRCSWWYSLKLNVDMD